MERHYPDALKFIPERWLREKDESNKDCPVTNVKTNPFTFLPFGHGARKCVGSRFASLEMEMLLAKVSQTYTF
jgi:cytochrome P450